MEKCPHRGSEKNRQQPTCTTAWNSSNSMKMNVRILLHYTRGDQIWIQHQDPKTQKRYEITPAAFHCGSSEEVLLLTNTRHRYLWTKRMVLVWTLWKQQVIQASMNMKCWIVTPSHLWNKAAVHTTAHPHKTVCMSWGYHIHSSIFHIQLKSWKTLWPTRDESLHKSLRMIKITKHVTSNI